MKRLKNRSRLSKLHSFTLVELLVVMAIIAILVGVLGVSVSAAINAAKRAKAGVIANSIQTGVLNYYTEYSVYPVPTTTTPADYMIQDTQAALWKPLVCALCGNISPYDATAVPATTITNTRSIAFLTLKRADVDANVAPLNPLPPDANHLYFNIAMDGDYDGILGATPSAVTTMPNFTATPFVPTGGGGSSTAGVAVWANCNINSGTNANFYVHTY